MLAITPAGLKIVRENIWGKVIGGIIELELQSPEGPDPDHRPGVVRNVPRQWIRPSIHWLGIRDVSHYTNRA